MSEESKHDRRHFFRYAAVTIAGAEFGKLGLRTPNPTTSPRG
jgi:hypothetical protein